jgi:hypothetical protein
MALSTDGPAYAAVRDVAQLVGSGDSLIVVGHTNHTETVRLSATEREDLIAQLASHRHTTPDQTPTQPPRTRP